MKEVWRTSSKIMVVVMLCASLLSALIGGMVLYQSSKVVEQNTYKNLEMTAENYASAFSKSTEKVESTLDSYMSSISGTIDFQALLANPDSYLQQYQEQTLVPLSKQFAEDNNKNFLGIYFDFNPDIPKNLAPDDQTYGVWCLDEDQSGKIERKAMELKKNFDPKNEKMSWYYGPVNAGTGVWSKPYIDVYTGYYMISYTAPLYYHQQLIGVAGIDMTFESVKTIIEKFKVLDSGYAFLLSSDYDVIINPKDENTTGSTKLTEINSNYQHLIDMIEQGTSKSVLIGKSSNQNFLSYGKMSNGFIFVIEVKSSEILKDLNYIRMVIDTMILFGIMLCAVVAYFLGKYIAKPVEEAQRRIHRLSCLDLQKDNHMINIYKNSEGQKMVDEIEMIRAATEKLILSLKENLNQEEIIQEKQEISINKLEIILERMQQNYDSSAGSGNLNEFQIEEGKRLLAQVKDHLRELKTINQKNKKLGGVYYLSEHTVFTEHQNTKYEGGKES